MRIFNGMRLGSGLLIGAVAVLAAPIVIPLVAAVMKPLAKAAIRGGLMAYEKGKVLVAEAREDLEDLMAEAKAEMSEESQEKMVVPEKNAVS